VKVETNDTVERLVAAIVAEGRRPVGLSADGRGVAYEQIPELARRLRAAGIELGEIKRVLAQIAAEAKAKADEYQAWAGDIGKFIRYAKVARR
jgi:hypothetical protein